MNARARDFRNISIGLIGGAALVACMGQAAPRPQPKAEPPIQQRYQITALRDQFGNDYLFVLDHQTQRVHRAGVNLPAGGAPVEQLIRSHP